METTTLSDFNFEKLPKSAQRAFFADADPLWPKNKKGDRVKPNQKKKKKAISPKKATAKSKKTTSKKSKKNTRRRKKPTGMSYEQKWAVGLISIGILTWAIVKKP